MKFSDSLIQNEFRPILG